MLLRTAALLATVALLAVRAAPPHVLFIVVDDLGWNDVSFRGAEYSTPTIDELAQSGIILDQYYVQPTCSPTRAALMSARYPYQTGLAHIVIHNGVPMNLPLNLTIIPEIMKQGGYQTHAVGKWDLGYTTWEMTPTYRGFDTFMGYYGAVEDYFHHSHAHKFINAPNQTCRGMDFRNQTEPLHKNNKYSTILFTQEIRNIIDNYQIGDDPMFLYAAYQAIHSPVQVPQEYIDNTECMSIPEAHRQIVCGMMKCLDEGIKNITDLLKSRGLHNDTIIILTTDNGGEASSGSSNFPLRGNKETVWEGGVRGLAFVSGSGILPQFQNTTNNGLMHVTDWLPTLAYIANVTIDNLHIDGVNQYHCIYRNATSARTEILLQLDPPAVYYNVSFIGQAALRSHQWKLILGQPNCTQATNWQSPYVPFKDSCPSGWVYINGTETPPPANPSLVWLFNILDDPLEQNDLSLKFPEIVAELRNRIEAYNSTHIPQQNPPFDPRSCPEKFHPPAWTPWLPSIEE